MTYDDAGYRIVSTWPDVARGYVVLEDETGMQSLWVVTPNMIPESAAYPSVTIEGRRYQFLTERLQRDDIDIFQQSGESV